MHPLLVLVVPAYLGAMALAIVGLSAAIVPAEIRRRREGRRERSSLAPTVASFPAS